MREVTLSPRSDRLLTHEQAEAAYTILVEEAGARDDPDERHSFTRYVMANGQEYRFMGLLGFGGKFRNRRPDELPQVDCYSEHMNPERVRIIEQTNARLKAMIEKTENER